MRVFRTRNRDGHHDHHTHVPTNGTRIITANDGHGHRRGATVVTVPATNVSSRHGHGHSHSHRRTPTVVAANVSNGHSHGHGTQVVTTSSRDHRYYGDNPSTMHGLWNKFLGSITGNRRRRRHGEREMRKARDQREALRIARGVQRTREGNMSKLRKFRERHRRNRSDREPIIIARDGRQSSRTPWMHHKHRTLPPYHGFHHSILGFFTRHNERRALGKAMAKAAEEDRRRERRRRREEMEDLGRRYRERRRR